MREPTDRMLLAILVLASTTLGCGQRAAPEAVESQQVMPRPASRSAEFAGSVACSECHQAIVKSYESHPMRLASGQVSVRELGDSKEVAIEAAEGLKYFVRSRNQGLLHAERFEKAGAMVYDSEHRVTHFIGAGSHQRYFALERGGELFQSPIRRQASGEFRLAHGYDTLNQHFDRRIDEQCLSCHFGNYDAAGSTRTVATRIGELGISCERCHGPAQKHVDFRHANSAGQTDDDPIVQIAELAADRQTDLCAQCHLWDAKTVLRYGRDEFAFRPGDRLCDIAIPFLPTKPEGEGLISQVVQMRESMCFQKSGGALTCTTCHDPHLASSSVQHYQQKCTECHHDQASMCKVSTKQQDDCIACHMPAIVEATGVHVSRTDHRILRHRDRSAQPPTVEYTFQPYGDTTQVVPDEELQRARSLVMGSYARFEYDILAAFVASRQLRSLQDYFPNDEPAMLQLSDLYRITNDESDAFQLIETILRQNPKQAGALRELTLIAYETDVLDIGIERGLSYLELAPWDNEITGRVVQMMGRAGRFDEGAELALAALERFPWDAQYPTWLSETYQKLGKPEIATKYRVRAEQLKD